MNDLMGVIVDILYGPSLTGRAFPSRESDHDDAWAAAGDDRRDRWYVDNLVRGDGGMREEEG